MTINAVIGAGIFGLPSRVHSLVGAYSLVSFVACGFAAALIALCLAEVASRFSATGGPYLYTRQAFGAVVGFEVGWLTWLARVTAFAANANLLVEYLGFFYPAASSGTGRAILICTTVLPLIILNVFGVRDAVNTANVFAVGKVVALVLFAGVGLFFVDSSRFVFGPLPQYSNFSTSVLLCLYAFTGFEMVAIPGGEMRNPRRDIPMGLVTGMAAILVIYVLVQIVCIGTLPGLAESRRPLADAATAFLGPSGAILITLAIVVSLAGNLNIVMLSASRMIFAMAERRELPSFLATIHGRFHTPHWSIVFTGIIMLALTLYSNFLAQLTISAIARLAAYVFTCAALIAFRLDRSAPPAELKIVAGPVIAVCAILLSAWLLSNSTWLEARNTAVAACAGLAVYAAYRLWLYSIKNA